MLPQCFSTYLYREPSTSPNNANHLYQAVLGKSYRLSSPQKDLTKCTSMLTLLDFLHENHGISAMRARQAIKEYESQLTIEQKNACDFFH